MWKRAFEVLLVAALIAGVAGAYFKVVGSIPVSVMQTQKTNTFDVMGEGKVAVKPDQAEITLGVQKEAASVAIATEQVDQVMQSLSAALKKIGVEEKDIKTTDYSVYQNYGERGVARSYTASSSVLVVIRDLTKVSAVVDLTGSLGLSQSGNLQFTLSDSLKDKTTSEARAIAIEAAKKKASELARLSGMKLGNIVNVQENMGGAVVPMYRTAVDAAGAKLESAPTPAQIESGTSEVHVALTLSYETR
jgi:hypothetical protein